ncbi:MAG: hypothetical protein GXP29_05390 [Planctomycetes bacterium]|nr:hypothetical protein [Planctomycetota bacterium]
MSGLAWRLRKIKYATPLVVFARNVTHRLSAAERLEWAAFLEAVRETYELAMFLRMK